jgi:para-aminobenzoate synthetase/4-amino-4-deoxychorismate lyase
MTSTVVADAPDVTLAAMFAALFPSGSVTGAPKHSSMNIIKRLEAGPRGIYTGAIGCIGPAGVAHFNVAIRSVTIDRGLGRAEFGVGSGIVWDSIAEGEFAECLNKAAMLARRAPSFQLIETMRWDGNGEIMRLPLHLARLQASAEYFGFEVPAREDLTSMLIAAADNRRSEVKVRLLLWRDGRTVCECQPITPSPSVLRVGLAAEPVRSDDVFLFHKTTRREVYERARAARRDVDGVLLWNERGELTEATEANVVVEIDGRRLTPQLSCGLLAGALRAELLARGEIEDAIVRIDDLSRASSIWLINSLRGWMPATLVQP